MNDSYLKALHEHQAGNMELAEKLYHSCLKDDPDNHEVLHLLGISSAQRQDFLNALYYIERALNLDPESATLHNSKGNVLRNLRRHEEAASHYKTALQLQPNNASIHNNLGNIYYHLDNIQTAKKHYLEAIRLRPQYVEAYYNLSLVLIKQNLLTDAIKSLELVLGLHPDHGNAHNNLAYLLQLQGDLDRAMPHYQKALEFCEDGAMSHHNLGVILTSRGKYDEAIRHFKKTLELQPHHTEALHNLGAVFLLQKKMQEALPYFLQLSRLSDNFDACYNLGTIYLDLGIFDEAIVYFNKALKMLPNDFAVNVNLGAIYLQRRDFALAEQYYLKASHLSPNNEAVRYILAAVQQKQSPSQSKAPIAYIKDLFDQYAPYFDRHLDVLGYKVPELLFESVQAVIGAMNVPLTILDLGCGTGMSGDKFQSIASRLIGIDISEKMLQVAKQKNIYTELMLDSIESALAKFSHIDVVIAADTLVYFGDLRDVFSKCHLALNPGGLFAFTVELSDTYPYVLLRSARFAHSYRYIQELALHNNFVILKFGKAVLRKHGDSFIEGGLFLLKKIH